MRSQKCGESESIGDDRSETEEGVDRRDSNVERGEAKVNACLKTHRKKTKLIESEKDLWISIE